MIDSITYAKTITIWFKFSDELPPENTELIIYYSNDCQPVFFLGEQENNLMFLLELIGTFKIKKSELTENAYWCLNPFK